MSLPDYLAQREQSGFYNPAEAVAKLSKYQHIEVDPSGLSLNTPGAKADAGKLRAALVLSGFADAITALIKVGTDGANKYSPNGWRQVTDGIQRYEDALVRHLIKYLSGEECDHDSGSPHLAHIAWNACAIQQLKKATNAK